MLGSFSAGTSELLPKSSLSLGEESPSSQFFWHNFGVAHDAHGISWIVSRCIQMYPVFIQKFIPNHSNFGGSMAFAALVALPPRCFLRQSLTTSHCSLLKPVYAKFQGMLWSRNAAKGAIIEMLFRMFRVDLACFCTYLYFL